MEEVKRIISHNMAKSTFVIRGKSINVIVNDSYFTEHWKSAENGSFEPATYDVFNEFIDKETIYFDLGAYIGSTCLYAAQLAKSAFAFEPDPVAFELLRENCEANEHISNLFIYPFAAGAKEDMINIMSRDSGGNSGSSLLLNDFKSSWQVPMIDINQFVAEKVKQEKVFLKIDIEGYEYSLLKELVPTLKKYKPTLFLALHPQILANTIKGQTLKDKIARRYKMVKEHFFLFAILATAKKIRQADGSSVSLNTLLKQILLKGSLDEKNKEFVLVF